jgi:hypothetical protein
LEDGKHLNKKEHGDEEENKRNTNRCGDKSHACLRTRQGGDNMSKGYRKKRTRVKD